MNQTKYIQSSSLTLKSGWRYLAAPLSALAFLALGLWNLGGPGLWWDEGWTLSVARNWAERGFYGRLLDGQLAPPGLEASFTTTIPVALAMRLFGVGIWQGRLFGVLCTVVALALSYTIAARLYDKVAARGTLFVLLFMSMHPQLHPLIQGRQVLAEMPMFCWLLAGYACLLAAFRRPTWLAPAAICWGIALVTKAQALPFWLVSLAVPLLAALVMRRWRMAAMLLVVLVGSQVVAQLLIRLWGLLIAGHTLAGAPVTGLYDVTAFVPNAFNRLFALGNIVMFGLPTALSLAYAAWRALRDRSAWAEHADRECVRLALLALASSWYAWFALLSVGVPRYFFPVTFFGSMFVAAWLSDLTGGFDLAATLERARGLFRKGHEKRQAAGALLAILLVAATLPITCQTLGREYILATDTSAQQVANFLNTQTQPDARIETYESELHFLLDRPYHYPPDQVHVELNRRGLLHQETAIQYDPLAADPNYLVIGRFARGNDLYEPAIKSGAFRLLRSYGSADGYMIYERVR
ncbi:MAG TPA: glycosyltransferase family 39 protein [Roseiflexaceae bacterium]|nr:glycosyltransferase family 39 protein [Roseiflexaceae bacterium]